MNNKIDANKIFFRRSLQNITPESSVRSLIVTQNAHEEKVLRIFHPPQFVGQKTPDTALSRSQRLRLGRATTQATSQLNLNSTARANQNFFDDCSHIHQQSEENRPRSQMMGSLNNMSVKEYRDMLFMFTQKQLSKQNSKIIFSPQKVVPKIHDVFDIQRRQKSKGHIFQQLVNLPKQIEKDCMFKKQIRRSMISHLKSQTYCHEQLLALKHIDQIKLKKFEPKCEKYNQKT